MSSDDGTKEVDATMYRQLVGSLIYQTTTRPNLAYSVSVLSQFMSKPLESHWVAAKSVLRYLSGTSNYGILYTNTSDVILTVFQIPIGQVTWMIEDLSQVTHSTLDLGS